MPVATAFYPVPILGLGLESRWSISPLHDRTVRESKTCPARGIRASASSGLGCDRLLALVAARHGARAGWARCLVPAHLGTAARPWNSFGRWIVVGYSRTRRAGRALGFRMFVDQAPPPEPDNRLTDARAHEADGVE
jgi:hypothetical protein